MAKRNEFVCLGDVMLGVAMEWMLDAWYPGLGCGAQDGRNGFSLLLISLKLTHRVIFSL